jgi:hypothetical protein
MSNRMREFLASAMSPQRAPARRASSSSHMGLVIDDDSADPTRPNHALLEEDEVEMPGGGQRSIDDLEASGELTDALLRKARPEVYETMTREPGLDISDEEIALPGGGAAGVESLRGAGTAMESLMRKGTPTAYRDMYGASPEERDRQQMERERLRRSSGASVTQAEFDNARRQPSPAVSNDPYAELRRRSGAAVTQAEMDAFDRSRGRR